MIQVYAFQQGRPAAEKDEFYQQLQRFMDEMKYSDNVILCGDFNCHVGCDRINYRELLGLIVLGIEMRVVRDCWMLLKQTT